MEKQFQEVFPDLRIEGGMAELLDTVEVSRVSINKKKDLLRIYVVSHQWIHKKYIYQLERQIEEQLFSNVPLRVKIIERFYLSRQYTPENFLEVYRPSILLELKNHSVFLNHLFSTARLPSRRRTKCTWCSWIPLWQRSARRSWSTFSRKSSVSGAAST